MIAVEPRILAALRELEALAQAMPTAHPKPDLRPLFARLEELAGELPPGSDRNLAHYLQRKSYQKARLLLEGRDAENAAGACGTGPAR